MGQERIFGVMDTYSVLTVVMASWVYTSAKTYQSVHFQCVQFIVYRLDHDKTFSTTMAFSQDELDLPS